MPTNSQNKKLENLKKAVERCRNCDLYKNATQAVFGSGAANASIMIVGEQPGHQEDLMGVPFVGPAGKVLRACLSEAGLEEDMIYMTNAVKHF